ncbi:MAG: ThiF family adenylyltransferase [Clostridia bacterium]|nr:ThiF family adenylyltransferase [Clostridia bacterium]
MNKEFLDTATSKLTDNNPNDISNYGTWGYGYQIWQAPNGGFAFIGMGDQFAVINPEAKVFCKNIFFDGESAKEIDFNEFDFVIDAIDSVSSKVFLIEKCNEYNIPIISAMGAGNKLDPTKFEVSDIYKTSVCPLAKVMRNRLKKLGIKKLKVVYSKEIPVEKKEEEKAPGSISFVPSVMGLILAGEVIKDLIK